MSPAGGIPVRVTVLDTWDTVALDGAPDLRVGDLKRQALRAAGSARRPDGCQVKYRGAVLEDDLSLAAAGVVPHAALIVLSTRRRPVR